MRIKQKIYIGIGCISLALGCLGAALPILPTVPFLLLTLYCFSRGSERLHRWFMGTKIYKEHLESYVQKRGMTKNTKIRIVVMLTALMGIGFVMMKNVLIGQIVLTIVWGVHVLYFMLIVDTLKGQ